MPAYAFENTANSVSCHTAHVFICENAPNGTSSPPHLPKLVSISLEGKQESKMIINPADEEELQGVIETWWMTFVGHPLACTCSINARKIKTASGQTFKLVIYEIGQESSMEGQDVPGHHVDNPGSDTTSVELAESLNEQTAPGGDHTDMMVKLASTMGT
ncbi:hypothetical protein JVT61DRAFT_9939 [Boletus reticuloceps]|uniref:Uncharacterized protein n=1 Tax=Boletus reticuloceps TaxID=495285 RepID=A0A8I3A4X2_9AGAM|nr:hypothetical protein JVT61DRAFT_9939 [Boletus reticuloceps]